MHFHPSIHFCLPRPRDDALSPLSLLYSQTEFLAHLDSLDLQTMLVSGLLNLVRRRRRFWPVVRLPAGPWPAELNIPPGLPEVLPLFESAALVPPPAPPLVPDRAPNVPKAQARPSLKALTRAVAPSFMSRSSSIASRREQTPTTWAVFQMAAAEDSADADATLEASSTATPRHLSRTHPPSVQLFAQSAPSDPLEYRGSVSLSASAMHR